MEAMNAAFTGAFRSAQLEYRPIEDTQADKAFFHNKLQRDLLTFAMASRGPHQPCTRKRSDDVIDDSVKNGLLSVFIYLPPPKRTPPGSGDAEEPTPIGILMLTDGGSMAYYRRTELMVMIAPAHQGRGYGGEAVSWAVDWAFTWAGVHRVELSTFTYNERAIALYHRLGFKLEGRNREVVYMNREWHDLLSFGILEQEWEALVESRG